MCAKERGRTKRLEIEPTSYVFSPRVWRKLFKPFYAPSFCSPVELRKKRDFAVSRPSHRKKLPIIAAIWDAAEKIETLPILPICPRSSQMIGDVCDLCFHKSAKSGTVGKQRNPRSSGIFPTCENQALIYGTVFCCVLGAICNFNVMI